MSNIEKPTSASKFKVRIANLHGRFQTHGGVGRGDVKVFHYGNGNDHTYSKTIIEKIAKHMATTLGPGFKLEINTKFGPEWVSGKLTDTTNNISMWDPTNEYAPKSSAVLLYNKEIDNIHRFNIVAVNYGGGMGGFGKHNDCFYDCLVKAFGGKQYLPWTRPSGLKRFLHLNRNDMIKLSQIDMIEDKANSAINVTTAEEDVYYKSTKQNVSKIINISLVNEHYTLNKPAKKLVTGVSIKERTIIFPCRFLPEGEKFYDGEKYFILAYDAVTEITHNPLTSEHVIVRAIYNDVEKEYKDYIAAVDELKAASNGKINFYKTGTVTTMALYLFEEFNLSTMRPDPISPVEAKFINGCPNYGMMYSTPYEGEAHMYDGRSWYGSILRSQIQFPHKEGNYKKITQEEFDAFEYVPFGYYHCEIIGNHKFFMKSSKHYYTSIDVIYAQKLGLKVKIIADGDTNLIEYPANKRIQASVLFRKYVDLLYPLKQQGLALAKSLLCCLWGVLCEGFKNREYILNLDKENEVIKLKDNEVIVGVKALKDKDGEAYMWRVETGRPDKVFKTDYARMKGFITAQGRKCIGEVMFEHSDHIVRVHTDGFISDKKLDIDLGLHIGDIKYEGHFKKCKVNGLNNIEVGCEHCNEMFQKNDLQDHIKTCKET